MTQRVGKSRADDRRSLLSEQLRLFFWIPRAASFVSVLLPTGATHVPYEPFSTLPRTAKALQFAGLSHEADEGIRTLDLRHGKATL
jgi:hypothetical protein